MAIVDAGPGPWKHEARLRASPYADRFGRAEYYVAILGKPFD